MQRVCFMYSLHWRTLQYNHRYRNYKVFYCVLKVLYKLFRCTPYIYCQINLHAKRGMPDLQHYNLYTCLIIDKKIFYPQNGVQIIPKMLYKLFPKCSKSYPQNAVQIIPKMLYKLFPKWCTNHFQNGVQIIPKMVYKFFSKLPES